MKRIHLEQSYRIYNPGERAGFPDAEADDLVRRGIGHEVPFDPAPAPTTGTEAGPPLRRVQLDQPYMVYNPGEKAGFPPAQAADIVQRKLGHYIEFDEAPVALVPAMLAKTVQLPAHPDVTAGGQSALAESPAADLATHELTIDEVAELLDQVTDPERVHALLLGEQQHPQHPGGRKGALEMLTLRAAELATPPAP